VIWPSNDTSSLDDYGEEEDPVNDVDEEDGEEYGQDND
jgi:hypothetical protein